MRVVFLLVLLAIQTQAQILRLSHVAPAEGPGITQFEYAHGDETLVLFVEDKAIITEAHIARAMKSVSREDAVDISLNPEGTDRMIEGTRDLEPGRARIAIIVDGKLISAPVVQMVPLGRNFIIYGLREEGEAAELAKRLSPRTRK